MKFKGWVLVRIYLRSKVYKASWQNRLHVWHKNKSKKWHVFETVHITGNLLTQFPFSSYPLICGIMQWHSCTKHSATRRSGEDCGPFHCLSNNITYLLILFINRVKSRANTRFMKLIKNAYTYGAPRKWCSTWQWPYSQMYHEVKGQLSGTDAHKNR